MTRKKRISSKSHTVPVGPLTQDLKNAFRARSIPLETDFSDVIDVADCGRRAVGLSPDFIPAGNTGLSLDENGQLHVVPDTVTGVRVSSTGLALAVDSTKGMVNSISGVGVLADANKGIEVSSDGVGVTVNPMGGLAVDSSGIAMAGPVRSAPVGTIVMWPFAVDNIPSGWFLCDGRSFDTAANPALAAVLGSSIVPNFSNRYPCGVDSEFSTVNIHISGRTGMPNGFSVNSPTGSGGAHSHSYLRVEDQDADAEGGNDPGYLLNTNGPQLQTSLAGRHSHSVTASSTHSSEKTRPAGISLNFIIACD